jgi:alpha-tubulin suppressor-like RCC1 family protein
MHRSSIGGLTAVALIAGAIAAGAPASAEAHSGPAGTSPSAQAGAVMAWGANGAGQLGVGTTTGPELCGTQDESRGLVREACSTLPVPVTSLVGVRSVVATGFRLFGEASLALLANGTVAEWGEGRHDVPVSVNGLQGVTAIAAGSGDRLALLNNGTVMSWGENVEGDLGDGSATESGPKPVAVRGLSGVTSIAAGGDMCFAVLSNGTVMEWGARAVKNSVSGELEASDVPVIVPGLSNVEAVSVNGNYEFALALLANGTVVNVESPTEPLPGLKGVRAISEGPYEGLALLDNGTVVYPGEPAVPLPGLSDVVAVSVGEENDLALLANGTVMSWGLNRWGELGDGLYGLGGGSEEPLPEHGEPQLVHDLSGVTAIAAGGGHDLAVTTRPAIAGVSPARGFYRGGTIVHITGVNLTGTSSVKFGAHAALGFLVTSPTSIAALAPAGTGTVEITVSGAGGESAGAAADRFTYEPSVSGVQAGGGPLGRLGLVSITGEDLTGATAVTFGALPARWFRVISPTLIEAAAPPGTGSVNVSVTSPGGTSAISTTDLFTYSVPGEWTRFPTADLGSGESRLDGISCVSSDFCVAVGHSELWFGEGLIEMWSGGAWTNVPPPSDLELFDVELTGVSCTSVRFCVAVGDGQYENGDEKTGHASFIDTWNGVSWREEPATSGTLRGVSCVTERWCVAVGDKNPRPGLLEAYVPAIEAWNGEQWSLTTPLGATSLSDEDVELTGVSCVSTRFCVTVGGTVIRGFGRPETGPTPSILSFNGSEWARVASASRGERHNFLNGVSCVSTTSCLAVGVGDGALIESFDGTDWSIAGGSSPANGQLNAVSCVSAESCTAVGEEGGTGGEPQRTLVERTAGASSTELPSVSGAGGGAQLSGVACLPLSRGRQQGCLAVGADEATAAGPQQALVEGGISP